MSTEQRRRTDVNGGGAERSSRENFEREGWACVPGLVDARTVAALLLASDALERAGAALEVDTAVLGVEYQVQSACGRVGQRAIRPGAFRKVTFASKGQAAFARLRQDPRLIGWLQSFGLEHPRCLVDQLNLKLPLVGTGFPFHQDAPFLAPPTRELLRRHGGANCVIALDAATEENGALELLGRTHRSGEAAFDYDTSATNDGVFDESRRVLVPQAPGDAVFFHPHLAHGSGRNRSSLPRRMVTLWFVGADAPPAVQARRRR